MLDGRHSLEHSEYGHLILRLKERLPAKRFEHSVNVSRTAIELAERHGVNTEKAALAGLLHDCAREIATPCLLQEAAANGIHVDAVSQSEPILLHAPLGAIMAARDYGSDDPAVLQAIRRHTVGGEDMTLLDMIIYLADFIEPGRKGPDFELLRRVAFDDLEEALLLGYDQSIRHVLSRQGGLHLDTVLGRNQILMKLRQHRHGGTST